MTSTKGKNKGPEEFYLVAVVQFYRLSDLSTKRLMVQTCLGQQRQSSCFASKCYFHIVV